jgi:hypothetical protein
MLHLPSHTAIAAAGEGTADLDAIHGRYDQPARPVRAQNAVPFQAAGDFAAKGENRLGRLPLEGVAERVVADRTDAFGSGPAAALGFDLQQAGDLHGRPQEDRVENLPPGMPGRLAAFRHGVDQTRKPEYFLQVGLATVAGQAY